MSHLALATTASVPALSIAMASGSAPDRDRLRRWLRWRLVDRDDLVLRADGHPEGFAVRADGNGAGFTREVNGTPGHGDAELDQESSLAE